MIFFFGFALFMYGYFLFFVFIFSWYFMEKDNKHGVAHKRKIPHKVAKWVRANPIHLKYGGNLPKTAHLSIYLFIALGGSFKNRRQSAKNKWYPADD